METTPLVEVDILDGLTWLDFAEIVNKLVQFEEGNIENEMRQQGSIYSYYYGLMSVAKSQADEAERTRDRLAATVRTKAREENRFKKLTAKDLDDLVLINDDVSDLENELTQATLKYDMLKGLVRALEHKKDCMVQISSNKRAETKLYQ